MNDKKLKQLVAEAVCLDREISAQQDRLKDMKTRLILEARSRPEEAAGTPGGGKAIAFQGLNGDIARVNLPGPALKAKIDRENAGFKSIKSAAGRHFDSLFVPTITYVPVEGFRVEAAELLGSSAPALVRLCETEGHPRVSFETKEPGSHPAA